MTDETGLGRGRSARGANRQAPMGDRLMTWFEHARDPGVVVRAAKTSALVGVLLVAINQGDLIVTAGFAALSVPKLVLTFFVPYAVSTNSSVASRMETQAAAGGAPR